MPGGASPRLAVERGHGRDRERGAPDPARPDPVVGAVAAVFGASVSDAAGEPWIVLPGSGGPDQGWKLHVSATVADAAAVLGRVLPVLAATGVPAKVAATLHHLGELNEGLRGPGQIGKLVTVYPRDDAEAVALAERLDEVTRGLAGPPIPSDRRLRPGSLVFYRYGGFRDRPVRTLLGEIVPGIVEPGGTVVPDRRDPSYRPPPWAADPFPGGDQPERGRRSLVVAGRFITMAVLHRSARGTVFLAVDRRSNARCILKMASPGWLVRGDGQSAQDLLRHEHSMLVRVAAHPSFPRPIDLVDDGGDLYLAMEDVEGPHLGEAAAALPLDGRGRQVAAWGAALARALHHLHGLGVVHADVKPENVIVEPGPARAGEVPRRVRLIDFDLAFELGGGASPAGVGSLGYRSPQRAWRVPPSPADDVWSLGAVLLSAASGLALQFVPRPDRLAELDLGALMPLAPAGLAQVLHRCLAVEAEDRFPSTGEVAEALDRVCAPARRHRRAALPARPEPAARRASLDLAVRTGDGLVALARGPEHASTAVALVPARTVTWRSDYVASQHGLTGDLNVGAAGPVLGLSELVAVVDDPRHREALHAAAAWLARAPRPDGYVAPGLWVGEGGRGAALLRAGQVLGDPGLVDAACRVGEEVAGLPHGSPDVYNGSAGRLLFHLLLGDETGDGAHLHHAVEAGEAIERTARGDGDGVRFVFPSGYEELSGDSRCLGFAHGAAGIGDALLELAEATSDDHWLVPAAGAARWIARQAVPWPAHGYRPDGRPALAWPRAEGGPPTRPAWCHGAVGIGRFLLRAAARLGDPGLLEVALGAAAATASTSVAATAGQCHGQAGAVDLLLDAYQATGDASHLAAARRVQATLPTHAFDGDERAGQTVGAGGVWWAAELPGRRSHELAGGGAGVLLALLRLADPDRRPAWLTRAAFGGPGRRS